MPVGWSNLVHAQVFVRLDACNKPLRSNRNCALPRGHGGRRHTSVVHECETCGRRFRSAPQYFSNPYIHEDERLGPFCYFCAGGKITGGKVK